MSDFAPGDVTTGTRLTIHGDFAELAAARARPKVIGRRSDTAKTVKFEVLAVSAGTIVARVREIPSSKSDPAAGKAWSLVVRSPLNGGETAEADEPFTTSGPALVSLPSAEARPGDTLPVYALDPGAKLPTVLVGKKKATVLRTLPAGPSRDDDPWLVQFRAPKLRNGFYSVKLENSLGRAPGSFPLLVFGGDVGGVAPYVRVAIEGLPTLDTALCTWSAHDGRVRIDACADAACSRTLALEFAPNLWGAYEPAKVELEDSSAGAQLHLRETSAGAKLLPAPTMDLLAGAFLATLRPADGAPGPERRVRGYFQAVPSDSLGAPELSAR